MVSGAAIRDECSSTPATVPDDGVRWLALLIAELFRVGLSLIAKRYPEARGTVRCEHCGHRQGM